MVRSSVATSRPVTASTTPTVWPPGRRMQSRSEEHTSELQSRLHLVCRLLLEKKTPGNHSNFPKAQESALAYPLETFGRIRHTGKCSYLSTFPGFCRCRWIDWRLAGVKRSRR